MRRSRSACVLALVVLELLQGITARKPNMLPAVEELFIQVGDELKIGCKGQGKIQFSTQKNMARGRQSEYYISFNEETDWYTFTRPSVWGADTGWYACAEEGVEILNDEQIIDHSDEDISWIYVYVTNSTTPFVIDSTDQWVRIPVISNRSLVVPCRPTSPDRPMHLRVATLTSDCRVRNIMHGDSSTYRRDRGSCSEPACSFRQLCDWSALILGRIATYDPKIGYIIDGIITSPCGRYLQCQSDDLYNGVYEIVYTTVEPMIIQSEATHAFVKSNLTLNCRTTKPAAGKTVSVHWEVPEHIPDERVSYERVPNEMGNEEGVWDTWNSKITIHDVKYNDSGEYVCVVKDLVTGALRTAKTDVWITYKTVIAVRGGGIVERGVSRYLLCMKRGHHLSNPKWTKIGDPEYFTNSETRNEIENLTGDKVEMRLHFSNISRKDNGTYQCIAENNHRTTSARADLIVIELPEVQIEYARPFLAGNVDLKWMVFDGNVPLQNYSIGIMKNGTDQWVEQWIDPWGTSGEIKTRNVSFSLEKGTAYRFRITARNSIGPSRTVYSEWVTTLSEDPVLSVPKFWIEEISNTSVKIGYSVPLAEQRDLVHYYKVGIREGIYETTHSFQTVQPESFVFKDLVTGRGYSIRMRACTNYSNECSGWSAERNVVVKAPVEGVNVILWVGLIVAVLTFIMIAIRIRVVMRKRKSDQPSLERSTVPFDDPSH